MIATGSGFFVSGAGHILTNNHVIADCGALTATFPGWHGPASLLRQDVRLDLAVVQADVRPERFATFRSGAVVRPGETAVAVGYPLQRFLSPEANVTVGAISATRGLGGDERRLQMSTPVQAGNSGGPLLDSAGNVIGVVVSKASDAFFVRNAGQLPQNINFAVPSVLATSFLSAAGVPVSFAASTRELRAPDIGDIGRMMTVRIECLGSRRTPQSRR